MKKNLYYIIIIFLTVIMLTLLVGKPLLTHTITFLSKNADPNTGTMSLKKLSNGLRTDEFAFEIVFSHNWDNIILDGFNIKDTTNLNRFYKNYTYFEFGGALVINAKLVKGDILTFTNIPNGVSFEAYETIRSDYDLAITGKGDVTINNVGDPYAYGTVTTGNHIEINFHNTYNKTSVPSKRELTLEKILDGHFIEWGINNDTVFRVKIKDVAANRYLTFDEDYYNTGVSVNGSYIEITARNPIVLKNIEIGRQYLIEEEGGDFYTISYSNNNFALSSDTLISVTNIFIEPTGDPPGVLIINKQLAGSYEDWGVNNTSLFRIRIKDVATNNYLTFNANYEYTGASPTGSYVEISVREPLMITRLPEGREYKIEEVSGLNYSISYSSDSIIIEPLINSVETVTNTYEAGVGNLVINKELAGSYNDWGIDQDTLFYARVKDVIEGVYIYFTLLEDGTYKAIGNNNSSLPTSDSREIVVFSTGIPVILTNLSTSGVYKVEEIEGPNCLITYDNNNATVISGENATVTVTNTYEHGMGNLILNKQLAGSYDDWGVDHTTIFQARIKDITEGYYLYFTKEEDGNYSMIGNNASSDATNDSREIVEFSSGTPTVLTNLWSSSTYLVEEIEGAHYTITYSGNNASFSQGGNVTVVVYNTYEHGVGNLILNKRLSGSFSDWGVNNNTMFQARVKDVSSNNYIYFYLQEDGTYYADGNNNSSLPTGDSREIIEFSANVQTVITNLWVNKVYLVEEITGEHYTITYFGNNSLLPQGDNMSVTITNTYEHGLGNLIIEKALVGSFSDWGVDPNTTFKTEIWDVTENKRLRFIETSSGYKCVGNDIDGLSEVLFPGVLWTNEITIINNKPTILSNLWANREYEAKEKIPSDAHYITSYSPNVTILEGKNGIITITNTYEPGRGDIVISKKLLGSYNDWNANDTTIFKTKIKDEITDAYLLLKDTKELDGSYMVVGNSLDGITEPYIGNTIDILNFSISEPLWITNLDISHTYKVEEILSSEYTPSYMGNNETLLVNKNTSIVITNLFEPKEKTNEELPLCACDFSYFIPSSTTILPMTDGSFKLTDNKGLITYLIPQNSTDFLITNDEKIALGIWQCNTNDKTWNFKVNNPQTSIPNIIIYCVLVIISIVSIVLIRRKSKVQL